MKNNLNRDVTPAKAGVQNNRWVWIPAFAGMTTLFFLTFSLVVLPACSKSSSSSIQVTTQAKKLYTCPMHPQYISDKPGDCPICNMRLVLKETSTGERHILYYRNPMNPSVTSPTPAKDTMGMDYIPVYEEGSSSAVPGQGIVHVAQGSEQLIGVKTAPAEKRDLVSTIRASARVAYDPGLYSAIQEHQEAAKALEKSHQSGVAPAFQEEAESTLRASATRLRQMGLPDEQIASIASGKMSAGNLLVAEAGATVWVYADLYDYEAPLVKSGQTVDLTSPAFPGQTFTGKVHSIDRVFNNETRTIRVRIEAANPRGDLKPDLYLNAAIHAILGRKLAVPASAVLDSGTRQIVYVQKQAGRFEPRTVKIGHSADDFVEILEGVQEGELVVTSANFLIDSESKLKAAAQ